MTLEELEFLRTILETYRQLKAEGKTDEEIIDYIEYCDIAANSHGGLEL